MSTIRVDNFGPSAGGTTYSARGIAKAWVNFNGTGTIAVRGSENVSSLTDQGTGITDVNYTSSLSSGNYSVSGTANDDTYYTDTLEPTSYLAGSIRLITYSRANSATGSSGREDLEFVNASIHGDLA